MILIPPLPTPEKKNVSAILEMDETRQEWRQDVNQETFTVVQATVPEVQNLCWIANQSYPSFGN